LISSGLLLLVFHDLGVPSLPQRRNLNREIFRNHNAHIVSLNKSVIHVKKMPFSDELRDETRDDQVTSDTFVNMKLVLVLTDKQLYAQSLCDFYAIYRTVEEAVVCWGDYPELAPLLALMENSSRRDAFETDLEFYVGSNWREITKPSFPAKEYRERVKLLSAEDPMLLIACVSNYIKISVFKCDLCL